MDCPKGSLMYQVKADGEWSLAVQLKELSAGERYNFLFSLLIKIVAASNNPSYCPLNKSLIENLDRKILNYVRFLLEALCESSESQKPSPAKVCVSVYNSLPDFLFEGQASGVVPVSCYLKTRAFLCEQIAHGWANGKDETEAQELLRNLRVYLQSNHNAEYHQTIIKAIREADKNCSVARLQTSLKIVGDFCKEVSVPKCWHSDLIRSLAIGLVKKMEEIDLCNLAEFGSILGEDAPLPAWELLKDQAKLIRQLSLVGDSLIQHLADAWERSLVFLTQTRWKIFSFDLVGKKIVLQNNFLATDDMAEVIKCLNKAVSEWQNPQPEVSVVLSLTCGEPGEVRKAQQHLIPAGFPSKLVIDVDG